MFNFKEKNKRPKGQLELYKTLTDQYFHRQFDTKEQEKKNIDPEFATPFSSENLLDKTLFIKYFLEKTTTQSIYYTHSVSARIEDAKSDHHCRNHSQRYLAFLVLIGITVSIWAMADNPQIFTKTHYHQVLNTTSGKYYTTSYESPDTIMLLPIFGLFLATACVCICCCDTRNITEFNLDSVTLSEESKQRHTAIKQVAQCFGIAEQASPRQDPSYYQAQFKEITKAIEQFATILESSSSHKDTLNTPLLQINQASNYGGFYNSQAADRKERAAQHQKQIESMEIIKNDINTYYNNIIKSCFPTLGKKIVQHTQKNDLEEGYALDEFQPGAATAPPLKTTTGETTEEAYTLQIN